MNKNIKKILGFLIVFIIGISTTVGAVTVFNSKDITYNSDKTEATNVKDSLDELYRKIGKCPDKSVCLDTMPISMIKIGDYVKMTPTSTSYTISKDLTGYTNDQTINPSKLNLWRVIKKNSDGTIEMISDDMSSDKIYFQGLTGFLNLIGTLNEIATSYSNSNFVIKTRYMGFSNQTEYCSSFDTCHGDELWKEDSELIKEALGTLKAANQEIGKGYYWVAGRERYLQPADDVTYTSGKAVYYSANHTGWDVYWLGLYNTKETQKIIYNASLRPIIILKSDILVVSGDGKSVATAYELK